MRSSNSSPSQARRWLLSGVLGALAAAVLTSLGVHAPVAFGLGRPQRRRPGRAVEQADQPPDQNFDHSLGQTLGQTVGSTCCRGRAGADTGDWSWALRNKQTGEVIGSDN